VVQRNNEQPDIEVLMKIERKAFRGFTLIEFAIANLAALSLMAATFTLMGSLFKSNNQMGDMIATQQNVRVAMNTIAQDIVMAGTGLPSAGVALPNGANSTLIIRPGMAGFADPDRDITAPNNVIPMVSPGDNSGPIVDANDTDALTIFAIDQTSPTWTINTIGVFNDRYEVTFNSDITAGASQLFPGDVLLFNNVNGSVLGCVSDNSTVTNTLSYFRAGDAMGVNQPAAANGNIGSLSNAGTNPAVFPPTTVTRVNIINYYISTDNAAHPRLMRAVNAQAPQILGDNIENLQFSFDLFDFNTDVENSNQSTTNSPNQLRAVNVSINGRSQQILQQSNDYFRFALTSKVTVRNSTFHNRYSSN
jgi:hypothetical protein